MNHSFAAGRAQLLAPACAYACAALAAPLLAHADDVAPGNTVEQVVVTTTKPAIPDNVPAVVAGMSAEQIQDSVNAVTTQETLKYLPSIAVRERYIGDRNGLVSTRTTGTNNPAQSLVTVDDLPISNLLGNMYSYPPRWGMVSPEEISRVDVIYGPFSALYPGNSMGGVVTITTRTPEKPEAHVDVKGFQENYKLYGTDHAYQGFDGNMAVGGRINPVMSLWLSGDHLDSHGHPMSFGALSPTNARPAASDPRVTGYIADTDAKGNPRLIGGANSIDHTVQDNGKMKVVADLTPDIHATYSLGVWENTTHNSVETYLRDASGNPVYNGKVNIGGTEYSIADNPNHADQLHLMHGLSVRQDGNGPWTWDIAGTHYDYVQDRTRTASQYGGATQGTITDLDGTGWNTAEVRGTWRPSADLAGRHAVTVGYHYDQYELDQHTANTANWQFGNAGSLAAASLGDTRTQAVYAEDAWKFLPQWTLTVGGRGEAWRAFDGANANAKGSVVYPVRTDHEFSPKAALAYQMTPDLSHRLSFGQAYRFPTVSELFQSITTGGALVTANPNLKPEEVRSFDWTSEYDVGSNVYRLSLFQEQRHNALVSQTDPLLSGSQTIYENVDRARIRGVELAAQTSNVLISGLDLQGSATFASSRTLSDRQFPAANGKRFPLIPDWRLTALAVYHQDDDLSYSLGVRYYGTAFANLDNSDVNHDTFGGNSSYLMADARVTYKLGDGFTAALGVDNLTDDKAYVYHPWPQITVFGELKFDY